MESTIAMSGHVGARVMRGERAPFLWRVRNLPHVLPGLAQEAVARALGMNHMSAKLYAVLRRADGRAVNYGLVGTQKITTEFCAFMVDQLQTETSVFGDFKHHDCGTGTTAENNADTGMETQATVITGDERIAGTQTEGTSVQYVSVATLSFDGSGAITEHGLFNTARGGSDTLLDRTVFSAINVASGDSIQFTYTLTCTAGG